MENLKVIYRSKAARLKRKPTAEASVQRLCGEDLQRKAGTKVE